VSRIDWVGHIKETTKYKRNDIKYFRLLCIQVTEVMLFHLQSTLCFSHIQSYPTWLQLRQTCYSPQMSYPVYVHLYHSPHLPRVVTSSTLVYTTFLNNT